MAVIEDVWGQVKRLISSLRKTIKREVSNIAIHAPGAVFELFFLYLELSKKVPTSCFTQKSLEALSDTSEVAAAQVVHPLTGDNIHYNMFTSNNLREQNFNRFQFPDDFARDLPESYEDVTHDLNVMQQFLTRACSRAKEVETRAIFSLFVEKLLQICNTEQSLVGHARRFAVAAVTEMKPVSVSVKIAESYMLENEALRDSESDPKRAVAMIRWLLKRCRSSEELNLEGWRAETSSLAAQGNPAVGQSDKKRPAGGPPGRTDEGGGGKRHSSVTPKNVAGAGLTIEDVWGNDSFGSSEDECDWDFFYAQQMQRQAGLCSSSVVVHSPLKRRPLCRVRGVPKVQP